MKSTERPLDPETSSTVAATTPAARLEPTPIAPVGAAPLEKLSLLERVNFRVMDTLLRRGKTATEAYLRTFTDALVGASVNRMLEHHGIEHLAAIPPHAGMILVANHRTYFDLYVLSMLLNRHTPLRQPIVCPVRADFFYQKPVGMLLNLLIGGGRMYPPVFRQTDKAEFNKWSLARIVELVREGTMIGFHPEGTRNKNADPYQPLPAQPGLGKIIMETWPVVVPAFINGLSNDFFGDVRKGFYDPDKRVIAVFGEPIDLTPYRGKSNRLATHKKMSDEILATVYRLGEEERRIRALPNPRFAR